MMSDVFSYQISDFIMYSKEALGGLLSNYNDDIWPTQLVWILISVFMFYILVFKNHLIKLVLLFFSLAWFYTGWFFYKENFSSINLASDYAFYFCVIQGLILLTFAFHKNISLSKNLLALCIIFLCMFVPFEWVYKDSISEVTMFGWGPLPVAIASVALVSLIKNRIKLLLLTIPLLIICFVVISHFYAQ